MGGIIPNKTDKPGKTANPTLCSIGNEWGTVSYLSYPSCLLTKIIKKEIKENFSGGNIPVFFISYGTFKAK